MNFNPRFSTHPLFRSLKHRLAKTAPRDCKQCRVEISPARETVLVYLSHRVVRDLVIVQQMLRRKLIYPNFYWDVSTSWVYVKIRLVLCVWIDWNVVSIVYFFCFYILLCLLLLVVSSHYLLSNISSYISFLCNQSLYTNIRIHYTSGGDEQRSLQKIRHRWMKLTFLIVIIHI